MKYTKSIILVLVFIIITNAKSQENKPFNETPNPPSKNVHEISYSLKAALGYSFLKGFNNGFNLGIQANLGIGYRVDVYEKYLDGIAEVVNLQVFARNLFLKNKSSVHFFYDLGVFSSFSYDEAALYDLGTSLSFFYGFKKLKIGQVFQISYFVENYGLGGEFPHYSFKPLIIRYKF